MFYDLFCILQFVVFAGVPTADATVDGVHVLLMLFFHESIIGDMLFSQLIPTITRGQQNFPVVSYMRILLYVWEVKNWYYTQKSLF